MVRKSYGKMRGTRHKLKSRGKPTISKFLKDFNNGDKVCIDFVPSSKLPHPRFQGLVGTVVGKRGKSYIVEIRDGNAPKKLMLRPEHLEK